MKERIAPKEYTIPVFDKLEHKINEMAIAIKIYHYGNEPDDDTKQLIAKPTWYSVIGLLDEIKKELSKYRVNPIKYKKL